MISELTIGGRYEDKKLHVDAMLVTPAEHERDDNVLLFEVNIKTAGENASNVSEWTFYIVGAQDRIYNATDVTEINLDGMVVLHVAYEFRPEFLYNDIRLGFLYAPYNRIEFIGISHD